MQLLFNYYSIISIHFPFISRNKHRWEQQIKESLHLSATFQPDNILRKINDVQYILHACLSLHLLHREQTESFLRYGISVCNAYLSKMNFYLGNTGERDGGQLANYQMDCYCYTEKEINEDPMLCEIVLRKFQLLVRLMKMRIYKSILATSSSGLMGYSSDVFYSQFVNRTLEVTVKEYLAKGNMSILQAFLQISPQSFFIHRYDMLSVIPFIVEPSEYCDYFPLFKETGVKEGEFYWGKEGKEFKVDLLNNHGLNWFERESILKELVLAVSE